MFDQTFKKKLLDLIETAVLQSGSSSVKMIFDYDVIVHQSDLACSSTINTIHVTLVGKDGQSEATALHSTFSFLRKTNELHCTISCPKDIGDLVLIVLQRTSFLFKDDWLPTLAEVESPIGKKYSFPIYHWITDDEEHYFREGAATLPFNDSKKLLKIRNKEINQRQEVYCWSEYAKGLPDTMMLSRTGALPPDDCFSFTRKVEMDYTLIKAIKELKLESWLECKDQWTSIRDIKGLYNHHHTHVADYVLQNWMDDAFFGYQFLNGINPMVIRRCSTLPKNFQVTNDIVSLHGTGTLKDELKKGNIFLCDYKILDGVETNTIDGKKQYLAAPLVLLQKTAENQMMPIAIQLKQTPAEDNPVFFPTDGWDWLLVKIFVRSADFNLHELNSHLLRTHLLAEVFGVALLRNLPMVHPVYKLLVPHIRYTLSINKLARQQLISEGGVFTKFAASGGDGMVTIMQRCLKSLTCRSLCVPDDIADRNMEDVPNFFYKDDALKLWNIIHSFVDKVLNHYYNDDNDVKEDGEVQKWISDIFKHGFLCNKKTGIPEKFTSLPELIKFVTMVMFTCSAQHSAVNSGQYDFYGWMPNAPSSLQKPPPTRKGETTEASVLETFPNVDTTVNAMAAVWLLSSIFSDAIFLGNYPKSHFTEEYPQQQIQLFQQQLKDLSTNIQNRNKNMALPYTYLDPAVVENSVSV